jgi:predicted nucleotidyltransferase/uncharacterized protein (UPF0332 family)
MVKKTKTSSNGEKPIPKNLPTLQLKSERDIAMDFATKVYQKFDKLIKSIILFGSTAKHLQTVGSDIDIIIIIDDASVKFTPELIVWYREELGKIMNSNPYQQDLHINSVKLTTWWKDLSIGDPVAVNILRYGETLIDFGGFFAPQKILLEQGSIKPTPEAIYIALNRVGDHIARSKQQELASIEGCYWAFVDSAQSLLMAKNILPPSPEHIPILLQENFVDKNLLKSKFIKQFYELYNLHKDIMHGKIKDIDGKIIDGFQDNAEEFYKATMKLIKEIIS